MSSSITILPAEGTWVVRARGSVIAESKATLELREDSAPPVYYFPRADIPSAFLDATDRKTTCPHKGEASYFSVATPETTLVNAAWSYETPHDAVGAIKGHVAFYASDDIMIERV